jgi:O-antigen ligase
MSAVSSLLRFAVLGGLFLVVVMAPTQHGIELRGKIHLSLVDPVVWVTFGAWALWMVASKRLNAFRVPPAFGFLFVLATAVSAFLVADRGGRAAAWKEVLQYSEYFLVATALFLGLLRGPAVRRCVVWLFLGVGTGVTIYGAWQYLDSSVASFDVRATFGNRSVFGGYLSLLLPLAFGMLVGGGAARWWDRAWLGLLVLVGVLIVLSGGTAVALALAFLAMAALRGQRVLVACAAALLLVGSTLAWMPRQNLDGIHDSIALYDENGTGSRRYMEWEAGVAMASMSPWCGAGPGAYQSQIGQFYGTIPVPPVKAEADSQMLYLVLAASIGVPGALAFLGLLFAGAGSAVRRHFRAGDGFDRGLALGAFGSLLAFAVNSLWSPLLVRGIGIPLAIVLALALSEGEEECRVKSAE